MKRKELILVKYISVHASTLQPVNVKQTTEVNLHFQTNLNKLYLIQQDKQCLDYLLRLDAALFNICRMLHRKTFIWHSHHAL